MKNMMLVTCVAILGLIFVSGAHAESIEAAIDNGCYPNPGTLTVPAGQTATNFALQVLSAGVDCYTGAAIEDKGWFIAIGDANGARVYEYSYSVNQYGEGKKQEPYGPLSSLSLNQGNYVIYVDGGKGAHLLADYNLV